MFNKFKKVILSIISSFIWGQSSYLFGQSFGKKILKNIVLHDDGKTLRETLKKVVISNVVWARAYIVSELADLPDKQAIMDRLLENQSKFGKFLTPFFGKDSAQEVMQLLQEHKRLTIELIRAIKNKTNTSAIEKQWQVNINDIAVFLNKINPDWSVQYLNKKFGGLLQLTKQEVVLRVNQDWAEDIKNFDAIMDYAANMADEFAEEIIKFLSVY